MRPILFWLLITSSSVPDEVNGKDVYEEDLLNEGMVAHRFTGLSTQRQRDRRITMRNYAYGRLTQPINISSSGRS
jgi:transcriptional enhancer factor